MLIETLGTRIRVIPDQTLAVHDVAQLRTAWSRTIVDSPAAEADITLTAGLSGSGSPADVVAENIPALMTALTQQITLRAIEAQRHRLLMLHAAGLAEVSTGRTIALIASSGTGKTTAARVLARDFGYVSDETVAVTSEWRVVPHAKPLSVRPATPGESRQVPPDELSLLQAPSDLGLTALAVLDRFPEATTPSVTRLGLTASLRLLIPQISYLPELPDGLERLVSLIAHCGGVWQLSYGEAETLGPLVRRVLAGAEPVADPWRTVEPVDTVGAAPVGRDVVRRAAASRAVTDDASTIVLQGREVIELQGVGPTIWAAAGTWIDIEQLARTLDREHGLPTADASLLEATARTVEQLVLLGVLERSPR